MVKNTGGDWDPEGDHIYFVASGPGMLTQAAKNNDSLLIAVNEMNTPESIDLVESWCDAGKSVFLDSGVFNLTNAHARANDISMDEALALPPDEIDGFDKLFEQYCAIVRRIGSKVFGYIEVDQGGRANKIKTRARTEALGFRPIPVYHPLIDGWDYFDELAEQYDRICLGNIVQANRAVRTRLLATAWERRRKYPHLWIHLLGMTPNELLNSYPVNSCDSSSWLAVVRWQADVAQSALKGAGRMGRNFKYIYGVDADSEEGANKAVRLGSYKASFVGENWRGMASEYESLLGCDRRSTL